MSNWRTQVHSGWRYNSICTIHVFADCCCRMIINIPSELKLSSPSQSSVGLCSDPCAFRGVLYCLSFIWPWLYWQWCYFFSIILSFFYFTSSIYLFHYFRNTGCCRLPWSHVVWADMIHSDRDKHNGEHECTWNASHKSTLTISFSIMTAQYLHQNHSNQKTVCITLTTAAGPYKVGTLMMWSTCVLLTESPTGWRKLLCFSRSSF